MPRLVIHGAQGRAHRHIVPEGTTLIGRGEDADLSLPNVSVSREHAKLHLRGGQLELEDLGSRNGTRVDGVQLPQNGRAKLRANQEVRVGKYRLTVLADDETFFQGRFVEYLHEWSPHSTGTQAATYAMSAAEARAFEEDARRIRESRVVLAANRRRFWYPEDRQLTFGGNAMVMVEGLFTGGLGAEIVWKDRKHVLRKLGGFLWTVQVNGAGIKEQALADGDTFRVGSSTFVYEGPGRAEAAPEEAWPENAE